MALTVFAAIWTGVTLLRIHKTNSMLFMVASGFSSALPCLGSIASWLGTSRIRVTPASVRTTRGLIGIGRSRFHAAEDIEGIVEEVSAQTGTRVFYRLRLRRRVGGDVTFAGAIGDKAEARNIADAIMHALGR